MRFYKYTAVFVPEKGEENVYNVLIPAYPEIHTFGESIEEARFMAQDALELVILNELEEGVLLKSDKKPKRVPKNAEVEEIVVSIHHQVSASPFAHVKDSPFKVA